MNTLLTCLLCVVLGALGALIWVVERNTRQQAKHKQWLAGQVEATRLAKETRDALHEVHAKETAHMAPADLARDVDAILDSRRKTTRNKSGSSH